MIPPFPHLFLQLPAVDDGDWKPALRAEVDLRRGRGEAPRQPLRSLFLAAGARGSGSSLAPDVLEVVGERVVGPATEWTVEVEVPGPGNPCSPEVIAAWRAVGVNRVSLALPATVPGPAPEGVWPEPSFKVRLETLMATASRLLSGGMPVVSVDIALPTGRSLGRAGMQQARGTVQVLDRIGVPQLAIREEDGGEGTTEKVGGPESDRLEDDGGGWPRLHEDLLGAGYQSVDGVHFFRRGPAPVHPRAILRREPVLGLGPAAVTFRNPERRGNVPEWQGYRSRALAGLAPVGWREHLNREEVRTERVWSRLRSWEGLRVGGMGPGSTRLIREWVAREWATVRGGRVILLPEGWVRMDGLVVDLLRTEDLDRG